MQTDAVEVKPSTIEWKGVFALRDFKKGEIVLHRDISHTTNENEVKKMSAEQQKYISFLNQTYVIMQAPEKFVNHSCEANTTAKDFCDVTIRDIKKWEEITANYGDDTQKKERCSVIVEARNARKWFIDNVLYMYIFPCHYQKYSIFDLKSMNQNYGQ